MEDRSVLVLVGNRIRMLRREKGLSQESLGEKGGFHFSYIGQIERGEKNISLINLARIAEALEVNLIQLFAYVEEDIKCTPMEQHIQDMIIMLRSSTEDKVLLAKNVLREITKGDYS